MAKKKIDNLDQIEAICFKVITDSKIKIAQDPTQHRYYKGNISTAEMVLEEVNRLRSEEKNVKSKKD